MVRNLHIVDLLITILLLTISTSTYSNKEFIYGITIDNYPHIYETHYPNTKLGRIVCEMNRLHEEDKYDQVIVLLKSAIDEERNIDLYFKFKYLLLSKFNQYGRWGEELDEILKLADDLHNIENDTIRAYLNYYLIKFDIKVVNFPLTKELQPTESALMSRDINELTQKAHELGLYELEIQLKQLMVSRGMMKLNLDQVLSWTQLTENDSLKVGRLGYIPWMKGLASMDTLTWIEMGFYLLNRCPKWDYLQRFQYAVNILVCSKLSGSESDFQTVQKQCLVSRRFLKDIEVDNHYFTTMLELSPFLDKDSVISYSNALVQGLGKVEKIRLSSDYVQYLSSKLVSNISIIAKQRRYLFIISVFLFISVVIVLFLTVILWKRQKKLTERNILQQGLISSVSHDIRMPLQQSINLLKTHQNDNIDPVIFELRKIISFINETTIHLKKGYLIKNYDLQTLVEETLSLYENSITRKNLTIKYQISKKEGEHLIPNQNFIITIRNLLLNAIEHNPPDGYILIDAEIQQENLQLLIENSTWEENRDQDFKGQGLNIIKFMMSDQPLFVDLKSSMEKDSIQFRLVWRINSN